jgi:Bacterial regulatory helix-turn-helix protein, lysR family
MAIPFPDWNDLRDILLITDAGSLSGAARIAGISQSTMSRRLSAIEAAPGASRWWPPRARWPWFTNGCGPK